MAWATGGYVQPGTTNANPCTLRRNTGTYANNQYSTVTVQALSAAQFNFVSATVRMSPTAGNESAYVGEWRSTNGGEGLAKYAIMLQNGSLTFNELAASGTAGAAATNDTITTEAESTTIRMGTSEGGGADTQRVTTTDATLSSGRPGLQTFTVSTVANARLTAWVGGDITAGGAVLRKNSLLRMFAGR